jgi:1,4-dihydroxy-2-naphthoate octaprenyltransferase
MLVVLGKVGPWLLLPLLTLPRAIQLSLQVQRQEGARLNATLANTAKLLLAFGVTLSAGLVLDPTAPHVVP